MHRTMQIVASRLVEVIDDRLSSSADDPAIDSIRHDQLKSARSVLADAYVVAPSPDGDPLIHLGHVFDLDEAELLLLGVAAAVEIDDRMGVVADLLCGGSSGLMTVGIALEVCGIDCGSRYGAAILDRGSALRRNRLLDAIGPASRLRRQLIISERVLSHLLGVDRPDPMVASLLRDTIAFTGASSHRIARVLDAGAPLVWLRSSPGGAAVAEAVGAFNVLNLPALVVDLAHLSAHVSPVDALAASAREAGLTGHGLVVTGLDALSTDPTAAAVERRHGMADAARTLEQAAIPVVVVSSERWRFGWTATVPLMLDVGEPSSERRLDLWVRASGKSAADLADVAAIRVSPEQIFSASAYADVLSTSADDPGPVSSLAEAARLVEASRDAPSVMDTGPKPKLRTDDLILPARTRDEVERIIRWGMLHRRFARQHDGPYVRSNKGTGLSVLLTGSPGTGKTLAAHVIADELGLELMQVSLSATVDKYIGETEKNLERIFTVAEARNVLLFFDEADALFGSRSEVKDARDRYANQEVAYLLQRIEYFNGITVLATNYRGNLDSAFIRRIQLIVTFPDPDEDVRRALWTAHLRPGEPFDPGDPVDLDALAVHADLSGGDIRNVCLGALYDAMSADEPLGMRHVRLSAGREFRKLGRREPDALRLP